MVRLRHRYVLAQINYEDPSSSTKGKSTLDKNHIFLSALNKSIRDLHGIHGMAKAKDGLFVNYFNTETNIIFIRMRRAVHPIVSSAIAYIKSINSEPVSIQTLYTSATIKHCNLFVQKHYRRELETTYGLLKTDVQRQEFKNAIQDASSKPFVVRFRKSR